MDSPIPAPAVEAADSQPTTDGPMGLAAVPCSPEIWSMIEDLAVELRALLWGDANDMTQGAMVGEPVECIAFAKWWIQRAKGLATDVPGNYPVFRENK